MSDWREQYARVRRWRDRIAPRSLDAESAEDSFFAFAQACAHLVDWLENDGSQPIRRAEAECHVTGSSALAFCRDVCNGAKHARLEEKNVSVAAKPTLVRTLQRDGEVIQTTVLKVELSLEWDGRWVPILEFADACLAAWEVLLMRHGLLGVDADGT
jgi:hypothetical protein